MAARPMTSSTTTTEGSRTSDTAPEHKWTPYSGPVLFTDPSGLRDYRSNQTEVSHCSLGDRSAQFTCHELISKYVLTNFIPPSVGNFVNSFTHVAFKQATLKGPSGLRDYRSNQTEFSQAVGVGDRSAEFTSDLAYLSRNAPGSSFPLAKNGRIGEIGWPVDHFKIVKGI